MRRRPHWLFRSVFPARWHWVIHLVIVLGLVQCWWTTVQGQVVIYNHHIHTLSWKDFIWPTCLGVLVWFEIGATWRGLRVWLAV